MAGCLTTSHVPTMHLEEIHWLLQPSCESVLPKPWQRVHISCIRKSHTPERGRERYVWGAIIQVAHFTLVPWVDHSCEIHVNSILQARNSVKDYAMEEHQCLPRYLQEEEEGWGGGDNDVCVLGMLWCILIVSWGSFVSSNGGTDICCVVIVD